MEFGTAAIGQSQRGATERRACNERLCLDGISRLRLRRPGKYAGWESDLDETIELDLLGFHEHQGCVFFACAREFAWMQTSQ